MHGIFNVQRIVEVICHTLHTLPTKCKHYQPDCHATVLSLARLHNHVLLFTAQSHVHVSHKVCAGLKCSLLTFPPILQWAP